MPSEGSPRWTREILVLSVFALCGLCCGAGPVNGGRAFVASSPHFTALAPSQQLADQVVSQAEAMRRDLAREWLGQELSPSDEPTAIFLQIATDRSHARTLLDPHGGRHLMWLVGDEQATTEHLLRHEVAHTVLASQFGASCPAWLQEGIASRYDNANRKRLRQQELASFCQLDSWPHLDQLLERSVLRSRWEYATAVSLTEFLLTQGGSQRLFAFAQQARQQGWNEALSCHYEIADLAMLQQAWQRHVRQQLRPGKQLAAR